MAKGVKISVASDTRDFGKGVKSGIIEPLEDAADVLSDLAKEGDQASGKLEDGFKAAQRETDDLKDEYKKLGKEINDTGRKGKSFGDDVKDGTNKAGEGMEDFKGEANSTAREAAASFDGSAESIGDAFQEVAANAFSGFGPAGAAAGLVAAAGLGLAFAAIESGGEDTEAYRERVAELGQEFIDTGGLGKTSLEYLIDQLKTMATETEDGKDSLADLQKLAGKAGSDYERLAEAFAGNTDGLKDLIKEQEEHLKLLEDEAEATDQSTKGAYKSAIEKSDAQSKIIDKLKETQKVAEEAEAAEAAYAAAGGPQLQQKADLIDSVQGSIDDAASSWEDYRDDETEALDPAAYLAGIEARISAASDYAANMETAQQKLSPEAYQYLVDQGVDFAPMLDSILNSGLIDQFNTTFTEAAAAGNSAVENGIDGDVAVDVDVTADTDKAETNVKKTETKKRTAKVEVKDTGTSKASKAIDKVASKKRTAKVGVSVSTAQAERDLKAFTNRRRSLTITVNTKDRDGKKVD